MRTQEFPPTPEQQCAGRASRDYTQKWNSASRRECQGHPIQRPKGMICRALTGDRANVYRLEATTGSPGSTAIVRVVPSPTSVSQSSLCSRGQSSMAGITIRCSIFALIRVITACAASTRPPTVSCETVPYHIPLSHTVTSDIRFTIFLAFQCLGCPVASDTRPLYSWARPPFPRVPGIRYSSFFFSVTSGYWSVCYGGPMSMYPRVRTLCSPFVRSDRTLVGPR